MPRTINRIFKPHPLVFFLLVGCVFLLVTLHGVSEALPPAKVHPLPPTLENWQASMDRSDYFDQVQKTTPDYLVWSQFPVKVYVEESDRASWTEAVTEAVRDWTAYLPLERVTNQDAADVVIFPSTPPLKFPPTQRARSAETRFELYTKQSDNVLYHRCSIFIKPDQADVYLKAAARHELGHALGIWGHSPIETDALYFSQVSQPLPLSERDINTLKRVYEQPTRLGWKLPPA